MLLPWRWDIGFIPRFMLGFGPLSSVFDFATFGVMLWDFMLARWSSSRAGSWNRWATQTLIIFAIRTRRIPFYRAARTATPTRRRHDHTRHVIRRAARFSTGLVIAVGAVRSRLRSTPS